MREVPPTAGLPLRWRDFVPGAASALPAGLAQFPGVPAAQIECSGTAALVIALTALRHEAPRRSVVLPAYTCPLVAIAVARCGLRPVLCDVRPGHFELCPESLAAACGDDTLAIVPTHLGGRVADLGPVLEVARRVGAQVVEDAAQALGGRWHGIPLGMQGDAGFYSLAVGKGLTIYEGGVLIARDETLRARLRSIADRITAPRPALEFRRQLELIGYAALYRPSLLRFAYGLPLRRALARGRWIEAVGDDFGPDIPLHRVGRWRRSVGARALARLPQFLRQLDHQAADRLPRLRAIAGLRVLEDANGGRGVWPFFMVLLPSRAARDAALARLWSAGLGVSRLFIHALPDYPYLARLFSGADVPNARDLADRLLTISNSPWLEEAEFSRICSVLATLAAGD